MTKQQTNQIKNIMITGMKSTWKPAVNGVHILELYILCIHPKYKEKLLIIGNYTTEYYGIRVLSCLALLDSCTIPVTSQLTFIKDTNCGIPFSKSLIAETVLLSPCNSGAWFSSFQAVNSNTFKK
uniref:Uncharacterized protein n=1 Tax=Falco tinnunculus TaxID=100819 RepID=A0A8C4V1H3_FALTI